MVVDAFAEAMSLPKVVIVGGGPGGVNAAKALSGVADVTLVDGKGFFEINWGSLRAITDTSFNALHSYDSIPGIGKVVIAHVTAVSLAAVSLDDGQSLPYDFLVLAPGSTYPDPAIKAFAGTLSTRQAAIQAEHERLVAAKRVLIVGGGAVGVELAAEILVDLPGKVVTLVSSPDRLMAGAPPKVGAACQSFLEKNGAKVVLGQKATEQPDGSFLLTDGSRLEADVVYRTVGIQPATAFLSSFGVTDDRGFIKVSETLQVLGHSNIFAVGDATDVKEVKLGYLAGGQGQLVAKNIQALLAGKPLTAWKPNGGFSVMMISLGRHWGTGHLGSLALTGFLGYMPAKLKSKDLFTGKTRKDLGIITA